MQNHSKVDLTTVVEKMSLPKLRASIRTPFDFAWAHDGDHLCDSSFKIHRHIIFDWMEQVGILASGILKKGIYVW